MTPGLLTRRGVATGLQVDRTLGGWLQSPGDVPLVGRGLGQGGKRTKPMAVPSSERLLASILP